MQKPRDFERVKVVVRVRPLFQNEAENEQESVIDVNFERNEICVKRTCANTDYASGNIVSKTHLTPFVFDRVFDNSFSQKQIYENVFHNLVDSVIQGFNGTIFAYGQTGTGKTFTMEGSWEHKDLGGVMPNSFDHIFEHIGQNPSKRYLVRASYLEIYQEEVRDLLSDVHGKNFDVRESPHGVYVKGLSTYLCSSFKEISELLVKGNKNRTVGATNMNEHSSRSHAIFQVTIETSESWDQDGEHIKVGKLNLVDLAGSERASKTGASGQRFKEAANINLSLSTLGNVISALVDGAGYIPYRDSKLTRLLQDSLGGNSRTIMVATAGPAAANSDETINTLRYASRAKNIQNKPRVNENPKDAVLRNYQEEIKRLRNLVEEKRSHRPIPSGNKSGMTQTPSSSGPSGQIQGILKGQNPIELMKESRVQQLHKLLEPYGIKFEGDLCEIMSQLQDRKTSLMKNTQLVKEDKEILLSKLQHARDEIQCAESECSDLVAQIQWLESKVLNSSGKVNLMQKMKSQNEEIEMKAKELEGQRVRQEKLREALERKEMTFQETLTSLSAAEEQVLNKMEKISKIERKSRALEKEVQEMKSEHSADAKRVDKCLLQMSRELKLKKAIVDNFLPSNVKKDLNNRIRYDDASDTYFVEPREVIPVKSIPADRMLLLPMFNQTRFKPLTPRPGIFFSNENLLLLQPDLPKWRGEHYVADKINPRIERLIKEAVQNIQKTLVVNCDNKASCKLWKSEAPSYTAVGPNILLRKIRCDKFLDFSFVPSDVNLPRGCNISTIPIPPRPSNFRKMTEQEALALPFIPSSGEVESEGNDPERQVGSSVRNLSYLNSGDRLNPGRNPQHGGSTLSAPKSTPKNIRPSRLHEEEDWISKTAMDFEIEEMERELMSVDVAHKMSKKVSGFSRPLTYNGLRPPSEDKELRSSEDIRSHRDKASGNSSHRIKDPTPNTRVPSPSSGRNSEARSQFPRTFQPKVEEMSWVRQPSLDSVVSINDSPQNDAPPRPRTARKVRGSEDLWRLQQFNSNEGIPDFGHPVPKSGADSKNTTTGQKLPTFRTSNDVGVTATAKPELDCDSDYEDCGIPDFGDPVARSGPGSTNNTTGQKLPTFRTSNDVGMTPADTTPELDCDSDYEDYLDEDDVTLEVTGKDFSDSNFSSDEEEKSCEGENVDSTSYKSRLINTACDSNYALSQPLESEYGERPQTRPSSQRRFTQLQPED